MSELDNIKERFEKVYILADENTHIVLSQLKKDIGWLLYQITSKQIPSDDEIMTEWNSAGGVYGDPAALTLSITKEDYINFRKGL